MNGMGWIQILLFMAILAGVARPLGLYIYQVLESREQTLLSRGLNPIEAVLRKFLGLDSAPEQSWESYTLSLATFSLLSLLSTFVLLRWQSIFPLNPQNFGDLTSHLAFNTAASFVTNTNWQSYGGESTLSYFSQTVALTGQNFFSAGVGFCVAIALLRGLSRDKGQTLGNFWVDLIRIQVHILLPLAIVLALFLVSQGVIQNLKPYLEVTTLEGGRQVLAQGPVASQVAIKMLGTNGGGFFNANAAHPFENPTPLANFIQMLAIFIIPSSLTYTLGRMVKNQKHGWAVWIAMSVVFVAFTAICWWAESAGNPRLASLGIDLSGGNMEGKETRFGIFGSALFAVVTTAASCGAVNAMHDSFTPLGGLIPLLNIQLGEVIFGGVGAGLYGILLFVILAIFIAGLMVGRTPEYLGKKIEAFEVKAAALAILVTALTILGFTAWASVSSWGSLGLNNQGPHGFSEILYAYTSAAGNNGSAFAGLTANAPHYNITLAIAMLLGRFLIIGPVLALAGSLVKKKILVAGAGSFPVEGPTFVFLLIGTLLIVGALTFLPSLAFGPVLEHFLMIHSSRLF